MKTLHALLLTVALVIGVIGMAGQTRAETAPTPAPAKSGTQHHGTSQGTSVRHTDRLDGILAQLSLTADQQQQIQAIRQKYAPTKPAAGSTPQVSAADRQKTRQEQNDEIAKLLTAEQKTKWDQLWAQTPAHGERHAAAGQHKTGTGATTPARSTSTGTGH